MITLINKYTDDITLVKNKEEPEDRHWQKNGGRVFEQPVDLKPTGHKALDFTYSTPLFS